MTELISQNHEDQLHWLHVPFSSIKRKILVDNDARRKEFRHEETNPFVNEGMEFNEVVCEKMSMTDFYNYKKVFEKEFDQSYEKLQLHEVHSDPFADIRFSFRLFKAWDEENNRVKLISYKDAHATYREYKYKLDMIATNIRSLGLTEKITKRGSSTFHEEWNQMSRLLYMSFLNLCVNHIMIIDRSPNSPQQHNFEACTEILDFTERKLFKKRNRNGNSPFRVLFNSCLKTIQQLKLIRRKNEFLIQTYVTQPKTQQLHGTCYYEKYQDIKNFLSKLQSSGDQKEMFDLYWGNAKIKSNVENCLEHSHDANLVDYKVMPGIVSFRSHLYVASDDRWWYHWDDSKPKNLIAIAYINDDLDTREIKNSIMELSHHPVTGELNPIISLFRTQNYTDEEIEAVAGVLGRILQKFKVDGRELFVFLKGVAGTGKSSIIELIASFFDPHLIANMSNKQEETFGLQGFEDKSLIIASDLTKSSTMDSGDILNLISGDLMTIRIKNKPQEFRRLVAHFLAAGNEVPAKWIDIGGNFRRRVFPIDFNIAPTPKDDTFKTRLIHSGGSSYRFLNCGFLRLFKEMPKGDIWDHLPERFLNNRDEFLAATSALRAWIYEIERLDIVNYGPELYWKFDDFQMAFKSWAVAKEKEYKEECRPDRIIPLLSERRCKIVSNEQRLWPIHPKEGQMSKHVTAEWIIGLCLGDMTVLTTGSTSTNGASNRPHHSKKRAALETTSEIPKRTRMPTRSDNEDPSLFHCPCCSTSYNKNIDKYYSCDQCEDLYMCLDCGSSSEQQEVLKQSHTFHDKSHMWIQHN